VEGSIVRGRGSEDCLGNAICVARCLVNLKGKASISAIFTCDEEIGGETTSAMVKRGYIGKKMAIVMDGGAYTVTIAQKGILVLKVIAHGQNGHASAPWAYENAIEKLVAGFARLRASWAQASSDDQWHNTMTPCMIHAGSADNQIPDRAEMTINIRFTKDGDVDKIIDMVKNITGLEVQTSRLCYPLYSCEEDPMLKAILEAIGKAFPEKEVKFSRMNGATDARHMRSMKVPVAVLGVPGGGAHSANEWVDLDGIKKYSDLLIDFAQKMASGI